MQVWCFHKTALSILWVHLLTRVDKYYLQYVDGGCLHLPQFVPIQQHLTAHHCSARQIPPQGAPAGKPISCSFSIRMHTVNNWGEEHRCKAAQAPQQNMLTTGPLSEQGKAPIEALTAWIWVVFACSPTAQPGMDPNPIKK